MISKTGFTLVELMIVLAVALIITAGIAMFMMQIFDLHSSVLEEQQYLNEGRSALFLFARELRKIDTEAYDWNDEENGHIIFYGKEKELIFYSTDLTYKRFTISSFDSWDEVFQLQEYILVENEEEEEGEEWIEEQLSIRPLAFEMYDVRFSYYDSDSGVWVGEWTSHSLPERIQLQFFYEEDEKGLSLKSREWLL